MYCDKVQTLLKVHISQQDDTSSQVADIKSILSSYSDQYCEQTYVRLSERDRAAVKQHK